MNEAQKKGNIGEEMSRREMAKKLATLGVLGAAFSAGASDAEATAPMDEAELQTLIERLINSRYEVNSQGYIELTGKVWSGEYGELHHQYWLFNSHDGLKVDASAALSKNVAEGSHQGVSVGNAAVSVNSIMRAADDLGVLGETNLIYHALHAKMHQNREAGATAALAGFAEWFAALEEVSPEFKEVVAQKVEEFSIRPIALEVHW